MHFACHRHTEGRSCPCSPLRVLKILVLVAIAIAGFGGVVMLLWNWLMPSLFGWHALTFPQAVGLLVLGRILFGGMRGGSRCPRRMASLPTAADKA